MIVYSRGSRRSRTPGRRASPFDCDPERVEMRGARLLHASRLLTPRLPHAKARSTRRKSVRCLEHPERMHIYSRGSRRSRTPGLRTKTRSSSNCAAIPIPPPNISKPHSKKATTRASCSSPCAKSPKHTASPKSPNEPTSNEKASTEPSPPKATHASQPSWRSPKRLG